MEKKRFSEQEKNFLLHLINNYKSVVKNKETNGATLQAKCKAWTEIQERFNCESDHLERTVTQLQKCWDNIKTKRKRQLAATKRARLVTGGGPIQISKDDNPAGAIILNATNVDLEDALDSNTVMLLTCASEQNQNYELSSEVFVPAQSLATVEEPRASAENEVPQIDLNVSSEPKTYKRKLLTAQQTAINVELGVWLNKLSKLTDGELELHQIKKKEAEIRQQMALEELEQLQHSREMAKKEQEIKIATAQQRFDFEKRLYKL